MPLENQHRRNINIPACISLLCLAFGLMSCTPPTPADSAVLTVEVQLQVDDAEKTVQVPLGVSVQTALESAKITLTSLDQVDPPSFTIIEKPLSVKVTRVTEKFETEETVIPFERQTVRNESLPDGQTMLIQPGVNGAQQTTFRLVFEDGLQISRGVFKTEILTEPLPEIVMVGVQAPFTPINIPGRLAYLASGNAWVMENNTGDRRPLVTTGDLDGRVFNLSPDGNWLLYTRKSDKEPAEEINTLWMVNLENRDARPVYLRINNIVHFAAWLPGKILRFVYSTVEPRATAPGWQANNDLWLRTINETGGIIADDEIIATNNGGIYGWWGTNFYFSQDGRRLAYARPDGIGLVDFEQKQIIPLAEIIPFQTRSDWAWSPAVSWSPDNALLYTVNHTAVSGLTSEEASPLFDLTAVVVQDGTPITLVAPTGMFAYPAASPILPDGRSLVAFLQAVFPEQSDTSRYRLNIMDRDGSNRKTIFPTEGLPGMEPQQVVWGPLTEDNSQIWIAVMYQGNLTLINPDTGLTQQITGDGSVGKIDWK